MPEEKKRGLFSKIENREDALKVVKDTSMAFFVFAALQAAASFWVGFSGLIDVVVYVVCGFFLRRASSRVAAVILLLLAGGGAAVTFLNRAGANLSGGTNIFLSLFILWVAIRAVEATFKLHGIFAAETDTKETPTT